jgi:hypothetical protein
MPADDLAARELTRDVSEARVNGFGQVSLYAAMTRRLEAARRDARSSLQAASGFLR